MRTIVCITLVAIFWLTPNRCVAADKTEVIQLSKEEEIKDAVNVSDAIDRLRDKVTECIQAKRAEPNKCFCLFPKEFAEFKKASETAVKRHPDWENIVVYYERRGQSVNLSFKGVSRQLEAKCEEELQPPLQKP